jgi:predicted dehydrogenase
MTKLRTAVIGVGIWGQNHARAYATYPRSELVAICDVDRARAAKVAEQCGAEQVFVDYRRMLKEAKLDAVSIVTPDFLHRELVEACVDADVAVLVEKPLATNQADLDAILDKAASSRSLFAVNYMMRWSPRYAKARDAVRHGYLGDVLLGEGRFHDVIHVPQSMLRWAAKSSPLFFVGIHIIDALLWVTGEQVAEVKAVAHRGLLTSQGIDTDDYVLALLSLKSRGTLIVEAGWCLPLSAKSYVDQHMRLVGTKAVIEVDHTHGGVEVYSDPLMDPYFGAIPNLGGYPLPSTSMGFLNGQRMFGQLKESVAHFVDCVLDDTPHIVTLEESRHTTEVMLAAHESAQAGGTVGLAS